MTKDKLGGRKTLVVEGFLEEFEKDEIKSRIDIVELFASFGVKLVNKGKSFVGSCPWHEDKEPSLSVDRQQGLYHCFGCGESGDVVSLVEKMKGVGFKDAMRYLKAQSGKLSLPPTQMTAERRMPDPSAARRSAVDVALLLDEVASRYTDALMDSKEARAYLAARGLDEAELITTFKLGFCAGDLSSVLSGSQKEGLAALGVLKQTGAEHFAHCIVIPLFDEPGHVAGFYGRRIISNSGPAHLYLPGPHRGIFNRAAVRVYNEEIILTESVIDALSLIKLGFQNAIPCYGVNGFTAEHEKLLRDERVKTVVVGFDKDEAGKRASQELAAKLQAQGIGIKVAVPPKGKDWNEYLLSGGNTEELKALIEAAPLLAAAMDAAADRALSVTREGERWIFHVSGVRYRISGVRELFSSSLRVNIRAESGGKKHIDNVDLYSARSRTAFAASLSALCSLEQTRVERDLVGILEHLEAERDRRLATTEASPQVMSEEEREIGLAFLKDPTLLDRVLSDLDELGYVGEEENKLLVYLAATSRRMEDPLSVLIVSESASGKSFLIECVRRLLPPEEVVAMTSLSDQALQYLGENALLHKFLVMGEAVHSPAVEHQVREMLSSRELSRLVTLKDEKTGELSSRMVRKPVVVSCALSTTNPYVNPENASRFFVVGADESEAQTRAIYARQRSKYSFRRHLDKGKNVDEILRRHRAAQSLLCSRLIVNPFAGALEFPSRLMRGRRDHERFLDLIASVCFLRQYLKDEKVREGVRFIECDLTDYRAAYRVMSRVIASTYQALPQQALGVYRTLCALARTKAAAEGLEVTEAGASQREIREHSGASAMTVKRSLRLLVDWEYITTHGERRRGSRLSYRLTNDENSLDNPSALIPSPEEVEAKFYGQKSGSSGSEWVTSGSDPLFRA
jgi:DNA primase catalytic core